MNLHWVQSNAGQLTRPAPGATAEKGDGLAWHCLACMPGLAAGGTIGGLHLGDLGDLGTLSSANLQVADLRTQWRDFNFLSADEIVGCTQYLSSDPLHVFLLSISSTFLRYSYFQL